MTIRNQRGIMQDVSDYMRCLKGASERTGDYCIWPNGKGEQAAGHMLHIRDALWSQIAIGICLLGSILFGNAMSNKIKNHLWKGELSHP